MLTRLHNLIQRFSFLFIFLTFTFLSFKINQYPQKLIWSDMEGYYMYLPSAFIYNSFTSNAIKDKNYLLPYPGTNKIFSKYTCGVAIMEFPFFITAHFLSKPLGYSPDGHSDIYPYSLMIAAIFYLTMSLFLLWKTLKKYYSNHITVFTLFALTAGTNLFYYSFFQPSMSHVYSFFLFSSIVSLSEKIFANQLAISVNLKYWLLLGIVCGLAVLIRPTNAVILIYPFYKFIKHPSTISFFKQLLHYRIQLLWATIVFLLPFTLQIFYWKYITGNWIVWSYGEEGFAYWKEPKLIRVLFDAWNGWLLYTPLAILPIIYLLKERKKNTHQERGTIYILIISTYLFASWWAWWFGGAFGHRSYVEYYTLLAMPLAGFIKWASSSLFSRIISYSILLVFIYYNLGLTFLYTPPWDGTNWTYQTLFAEITKLFPF